MKRRVLEANLRNDPALLDEVDGLLATIEDGWNGIKMQVNGSAAPAQVATVA